ncbi:5-methylcytosine restriction system specificity protein McrC [Nucisporomicrobium flavum]|uniref:5-methylcytosine restriction system specificity protein McrC n=1 Tax=Nucisporomicrobium flavum TaxID=2785915 RepID=UPI0018F65716|nr:hypothetical protein [Nucisporomicrobium flavum]
MTITLAAAPRGGTIGFTTVGDRDRQLTIGVLPKAWRPAGRSKVVQSSEWPAGGHQSVALYETDRWHVATSDSGLDRLLMRCLQVSQDRDPDSSWGDSALLTMDILPSPARLSAAVPVDTAGDASVTDLVMLFDRLKVLFPESDELDGALTHSPLHRPLLCRRLLKEVLELAHSARRGYRSVTSVGGTIRGRISPTSIAQHVATGDPRLTVSYNELTESTVLLGIITAALEQIADGFALRSPFDGEYSAAALEQDAVSLRRAFSEVTALPSAKARLLGHRLRLSRLDQPWLPALQMSLTLLDEKEHSPQYADARLTDAIELAVPTHRLWERIVTEAMRRAGFTELFHHSVQPVGLTSDPWLTSTGKGTGSRPDNVARLGGHLWVVDAKYKTPPDGAWPSRDDQYQIFAYTHLVQHRGEAATRAALVYPGLGKTKGWRRGRGNAAEPCDLLAVQIPFPAPQEARSQTAWKNYLDRAGWALRQAIATPELS